jgi:hypothetical protein
MVGSVLVGFRIAKMAHVRCSFVIQIAFKPFACVASQLRVAGRLGMGIGIDVRIVRTRAAHASA